MSENIKQPLGVMPEYLWEETRCRELARAIHERLNAGFTPALEWVDELSRRFPAVSARRHASESLADPSEAEQYRAALPAEPEQEECWRVIYPSGAKSHWHNANDAERIAQTIPDSRVVHLVEKREREWERWRVNANNWL
jgi:hypothetical protein